MKKRISNMIEVEHYIDNKGRLVINASGDYFSWGTVIVPRIIGGYPHIKRDFINTEGIDNSKEVQEMIIDAITTQRGKYNGVHVVVDDK